MKQKRMIALLTMITLIFSALNLAPAMAEVADVQQALNSAVAYYNSLGTLNDWEALGLRAAGVDTDIIREKYEIGALATPTDYAKTIIGFIGGQKDVANCEQSEKMVNLQQALTGFEVQEGEDAGLFHNENSANQLSDQQWSIIALDMLGADYNEETAIAKLIAMQGAQGEFDAWGFPDYAMDQTAWTLIPLSNHADAAGVTESISNAIEFLKSKHVSTLSGTTDTIAAVIEGLIASDTIQQYGQVEYEALVNQLLAYQLEDGSFRMGSVWDTEGNTNPMSTYHALMALVDGVNGQSKYQYGYLNYNPVAESEDFVIKVLDKPQYFSFNGDANVTVEITNKSQEDKSTLFIIALYNKENSQMEKYSYLTKTVVSGNTETITGGFNLPASGDYEVKVMVWSQWDVSTALLDAIVIPVQ